MPRIPRRKSATAKKRRPKAPRKTRQTASSPTARVVAQAHGLERQGLFGISVRLWEEEAKKLENKGKLKDAADAYVNARQFEKAAELFRAIGNRKRADELLKKRHSLARAPVGF